MNVYSKNRIKIYLLLFIMALIYLRSVFGEFSGIDDKDLITHLNSLESSDITNLFIGQRNNALYYRPLLILSFYFEKSFLILDPAVMRLDNVLLQLANTLWVYFIVVRIYMMKRLEKGLWPFFWALAFGLHPLATESVNWVSGRTDLLAGFFALCATWLALNYRDKPTPIGLILVVLSTFCAILSKEVAIAIAPGLLLLVIAADDGVHRGRRVISIGLYRLLALGACSVVALCSFVFLRSQLINTSMNGINLTFRAFYNDYIYSGMLFFRVFGFYSKKIIFPWPINFAIDGVDPVYDLVGVVIVMLLVWCFLRNSLSTDFYVVAGLLLLPAYPISFGQVAWMPYAERYAYIATAFVVFGASATMAKFTQRRIPHLATLALLVTIISFFAATTYQRNGVWQTKIGLWGAAAQQTPGAPSVHTNYAVALYQAGDFEAAGVEFDRARSGQGYAYSPENGIRYGQFLAVTGRRAEAVIAWRDVLAQTDGKSEEALTELVTLCNRPLMLEVCGGYQVVANDLAQLYEMTSNPEYRIKQAELHASTDEYLRAITLYRQLQGDIPAADQSLRTKVQERLVDLERRLQ